MKTYSAKEVASRLGATPQAFRKWLRSSEYAGSAIARDDKGQYRFTDADVDLIAASYEPIAQRVIPSIVVDEPEVIVIPQMTPELRRVIAEQERRLLKRLSDCGLSVSQSF